MDLQNIKIKILAKANIEFELFYPPAKAGGNSNKEAIQKKIQLLSP